MYDQKFRLESEKPGRRLRSMKLAVCLQFHARWLRQNHDVRLAGRLYQRVIAK
jgi:hypothetical protein